MTDKAAHFAEWTGYLTRIHISYPAPCDNPYLNIDGHVLIVRPDRKKEQVPLFWSGRHSFAGNYRPTHSGRHEYTAALHDRTSGATVEHVGAFEISAAQVNVYGAHAPEAKGGDGRYLETSDGAPFLWLADTWWYGATRRCGWPEPFQTLVRDRADKGFSVIQMVVGTPPEIPAEHPDAQNEGGYPFTRRWDLINPAYFDFVDRRIEYLVAQGLTPCILGGWGFHLEWMGQELMERYWAYLVARYGAYPVVWCLAGESDLADNSRRVHETAEPSSQRLRQRVAGRLPAGLRGRLHRIKSEITRLTPASKPPAHPDRSEGWRAVGDRVRQEDGGRHLISIHPIVGRYAHEALGDPSWVGFTGIQSGHAESRRAAVGTLILAARNLRPDLPVINLEPWYEGILAQFHGPDQRYAFWVSMLAGAAGHTYGAHGLWNMGGTDRFMGHWGASRWESAYQLPGAAQLGLAAQFLRTLEWWTTQPQLDLIADGWAEERPRQPLAARMGDRSLIVYFPIGRAAVEYRLHRPLDTERWSGIWLDPRTGDQTPVSSLENGERLPWPPDEQDWVLLLQQA